MTTLTFSIRHESWERALVFLGPDAEDRAYTRVLASFDEWSEWRAVLEFSGDTGTKEGREAAIEALQEAGWLDSWDFQDGEIAE